MITSPTATRRSPLYVEDHLFSNEKGFFCPSWTATTEGAFDFLVIPPRRDHLKPEWARTLQENLKPRARLGCSTCRWAARRLRHRWPRKDLQGKGSTGQLAQSASRKQKLTATLSAPDLFHSSHKYITMNHNIIYKLPATGFMWIFKNQSCSLRIGSEFVLLITNKKSCKINCERTNEKHAKSVIFHSFSSCSSEAWCMVSESSGRRGEDQNKNQKMMIPQKGVYLPPNWCQISKQIPLHCLLCILSNNYLTLFQQMSP